MSDLIGVPEEHRDGVPGLDRGLLGGDQPRGHRRTGDEHLRPVRGRCWPSAGSTPADDLMSALLAAQVDGEALSDDDLLGFCFLLLVAGNDTTTSLIGNGVELLARHPDQRAELVADPSLIPAAIEEMVRIESPTQALPRTATRGRRAARDHHPRRARG